MNSIIVISKAWRSYRIIRTALKKGIRYSYFYYQKHPKFHLSKEPEFLGNICKWNRGKNTFPDAFSNAATISKTDVPFPVPKLKTSQPVMTYTVQTLECFNFHLSLLAILIRTLKKKPERRKSEGCNRPKERTQKNSLLMTKSLLSAPEFKNFMA